MDDRIEVDQNPVIVDRRKCGGPMAGAPDVQFHPPPEGCESQQLLDWAAISGLMLHPSMSKEMKTRAVRAYAVKWDVPLKVLHPDGSVTRERPTPESFS